MTNLPDHISSERVKAAVMALGITDLDEVCEVRLRPNSVHVTTFVRDESGEVVVDGDGAVTNTVVIPVEFVPERHVDEQDRGLRADVANVFASLAAAVKPNDSRSPQRGH
jgi:hypothetical protein